MRNSAEHKIVTFNTGLVAGRTIIDRNSSDYIFRPDGMDGWILNCTIKGAGQIRCGQSQIVCSVQDLYLFPAGVPHDYGRFVEAQNWIHLWVYFFPRESWSKLLQWRNVGAGVLHARITDEVLWTTIVNRMETLIVLAKSMRHLRIDLAMNALEEILLWCCESSASDFHLTDERIGSAISYMQMKYADVITIDTLAKQCNLSASRFAHLFTLQVKQTPMRYLELYRIRIAQELLLGSSRSVSEIAFQCGFSDSLYFSHVFKRVTGKSPRNFRRTAVG